LRFEIAAGAVLAQNTAWTGAERALLGLARRGALSPEGVLGLSADELMSILKPAGTFRIKAAYLRSVAAAWRELDTGAPGREALLGVPGIGPETADCILLYAYGSPVFVADSYARRFLYRLGYPIDGSSYERSRLYAEGRLPREAPYLAEAHALVVEHCKRRCRVRPACDGYPLAPACAFALGATRKICEEDMSEEREMRLD